MPCYHPLKGYIASEVNPATGKRSIVFQKREALTPLPVYVPCGQCIGCRLERSRQWAVRCVNEASLHEDNCFITLTFNDENLPSDGSLHVADFQKFMKRLRRMFPEKKIRFFHCGEYGHLFSRPHHHACLFNFRFPDLVFYSERQKTRLYRSEILEKLWPYGFCTVGDVTFESAAYVARYIVKKMSGPRGEEIYNGRHPEYTTMSRKPGIGAEWFDQFSDDCYPHDYMVIRNGIKCRPPQYYERRYDLKCPEKLLDIKRERADNAFNNPNNTRDRLFVREELQYRRAKKLERSFENAH